MLLDQSKKEKPIKLKTIRRSLKFSLDFANSNKKGEIENLWQHYQKLVQYYINWLISNQQEVARHYVPEDIVKHAKTILSYRYRQCAKRQAEGIIHSWNKKKGSKKPPVFEKPSMILDQRFVEIQKSETATHFDFWLKLSTSEKRKIKLFPIKNYDYAKDYFDNWEMLKTFRLVKRKDSRWFVELTFEKEIEFTKKEKAVGIDVGYRKLIATSDGKIFGEAIKTLCEKSLNKKQGSKNDKKLRQTIKNQTGFAVNQFIEWIVRAGVGKIIFEALKYLKRNKSGKWSRSINRRFSYWAYSYALKRIKEQAEVVGVQCLSVPPKGTSITCPRCNFQSAENRRGEVFRCLACGFTEDSDLVGATNVLCRFYGEPIVPRVPERWDRCP